MKITSHMTDEAALHELGDRLAHARLDRGLTQAALAQQAGVAKRTVERLEAGAVATQISGLLRICRVLGLLDRFESLAPEAAPGPMAQLRMQGRKRQRAAGKKALPAAAKPWNWAGS